MEEPPRRDLPRRGTAKLPDESEMGFWIRDEICRQQTDLPNKELRLQLLQLDDGDRHEVRLGYYIEQKKPGPGLGEWKWGQYTTMVPMSDLTALMKEAQRRGWQNRKP